MLSDNVPGTGVLRSSGDSVRTAAVLCGYVHEPRWYAWRSNPLVRSHARLLEIKRRLDSYEGRWGWRTCWPLFQHPVTPRKRTCASQSVVWSWNGLQWLHWNISGLDINEVPTCWWYEAIVLVLQLFRTSRFNFIILSWYWMSERSHTCFKAFDGVISVSTEWHIILGKQGLEEASMGMWGHQHAATTCRNNQ